MRLHELYSYFSGRTVSVKYPGYEEPFAIPKAGRDVVNEAVQAAVKEKRLWLISGQASLLAEEVPPDVLVDNAVLQVPPPPLSAKDVIPDNLPEAWNGKPETTARDIADALSTKAGKPLPWVIVRDALAAAFNARFVERSGPWPCDYAAARMLTVAQRVEQTSQQPLPAARRERDTTPWAHEAVREPASTLAYAPVSVPGTLAAHATLSVSQLQDLDEQIAALTKACVDYFGVEPAFSLRIEVQPKLAVRGEHIEKVNQILAQVSPTLKLG